MIRNMWRWNWMSILSGLALMLETIPSGRAQPQPTARWDFDDVPGLLTATFGEDLELVGTHQKVPGLTADDGAAVIWTGSYYIAHHWLAANGGGSYVNQYTIVMDIKLPVLGKWYSLYNTNETNSNDADVYINDTGHIGVGDTGYSADPLSAGFWHRVAIVVDLAAGTVDYYVNGALLHHGTEGQALDGRFSMYSTSDPTPWFVLFGDPNGYDAPILVSMVEIFDTPLTAAEVAALKGPGGNTGPVEGLPVSLDNLPPQRPSIVSMNPAQPRGLDSVTLTSSAFVSPVNKTHKKTTWQLSFDPAFTNDPANNKVLYKSVEAETNLTSLTLENSLFPFDVPVYVRVQYTDDLGTPSDFSAATAVTLKKPNDAKVLQSETFESAAIDGLPAGWKALNFTDDVSGMEGLEYYNPQLMGWSVQEESFLRTLTYYPSYAGEGADVNQIGYPIVDGKFAHADSGNYASQEVIYEAHLASPVYDLSGVTNVMISFSSNYVQNQDNIAALEYSVDGGDLVDGGVTGTWLPALYYVEPEDLARTAEGQVDVETILNNTGETQSRFYGEFIYADDTATDLQSLAPFFVTRINDGYKDGKRFEKIRLTGADNQSRVRFRWTFMGSWSWYWGIDNVQVWGNDGTVTAVPEWSIY